MIQSAVAVQAGEHAYSMNGMNTNGYWRDIDGLHRIRVLALSSVTPVFPFFRRYVGVDVFFVIYGYLVSALMFPISCQASSASVPFTKAHEAHFAALLTVVSAFTLLGAFLLAPQELEVLSAQTISALSSTPNIFFWLRTSYFAPHAELQPMLMTWSLAWKNSFLFSSRFLLE